MIADLHVVIMKIGHSKGFQTEPSPNWPTITGPKHVVSAFWLVNPPPCNDLDADTVYALGPDADLGMFSIRLSTVPTILEINYNKDEIKQAHHTDKFQNDFVVRRAQSFDVTIRLSKEYSPDCHQVYVANGPYFSGAVPVDQWGLQEIESTRNSDQTYTKKIRVWVPNDAIIGQYAFDARVVEWANLSYNIALSPFPEPAFVLFNPWSQFDCVYYPNISDLSEYVLEEKGRIWWGDGYIPAVYKDWSFDQFDPIVLRTVIGLLNTGNFLGDRSSPIDVSRHLTGRINADGRYVDPGVIFANWTSDLSGGKEPGYWTGSGQILRQFYSLGMPVKWAQCWVFAGLLNTTYRCLGIPSRVVTVFDAAIDRAFPTDGFVDGYFVIRSPPFGHFFLMVDPTYIDQRDSWWNFHVWCDGWQCRPDRLGHEGWQALDASPRLHIPFGPYELGPAPLTAVRNNAGGDHDVDFVYSEVSAGQRAWVSYPGELNPTLLGQSPGHYGKNITTKDIGSNNPVDITGQYKNSNFETSSSTMLGSSGIEVTLNLPQSIAIGDPIDWQISFHNTGASQRQITVSLEGTAIVYNGNFLGDIGKSQPTLTLGAGATQVAALTVPFSTYSRYLRATSTFQVAVGILVQETSDSFVDLHRTGIEKGSLNLSITPTSTIPALSQSVTAAANYTNPSSLALTNARMVFSTDSGLSIAGSHVQVIGNVAAGGAISASRQVSGVTPGAHIVSARLESDQFEGDLGSQFIDVFSDCNHNGLDDRAEVRSQSVPDCNSDGIPDSCEPDCNFNGVPDICDARSGTSADCNYNLVPDECEPVCGSGQGCQSDCDRNGIPDACDPDCNGNSIPDGCDISSGTSADCNRNGVPDSCEAQLCLQPDLGCKDCNGNGVLDSCDIQNRTSFDCNANGRPDACDISLGVSVDCNVNNVPDECEGDCNYNGVHDVCDLYWGTSNDCNANGVPDECDLMEDWDRDCNHDGFLDECQALGGNQFREGFADYAGIPARGWVLINNSLPLGPYGWFAAVDAYVQTPRSNIMAASRDSVDPNAETATISNWLITPTLALANGATFEFVTEGGVYQPDRLQIRMSTAGSSTNVGSSAESVGDFSTLLLDINSTQLNWTYPYSWARFVVTIDGLSNPTTGRLAFRYYVTNAGWSGGNGDFVAIDDVKFTNSTLPNQMDCNGNQVMDSCEYGNCLKGDWDSPC